MSESLGRTPRTLPQELLSHATTLMLAASVCLNVVQAKRLGVFDSRETLPLPGMVAAPIHATSLDGYPVTIAYGPVPTLLYYFSPTCKWCERNWANIKALAQAAGGRYRVVGLSASPDVARFVTDQNLAFEVYTSVAPADASAYAFHGTPHTVLVSSDGLVTRAWAGAYTSAIQSEIERALGVHLPGLTPIALNSLPH